MTQTEFTKKLAKTANVNIKDVKAVLNVFKDVVADSLNTDDKITLLGLATFVVEEKPDTVKDLLGKKDVKVKGGRFIKVKLSKNFRKALVK